MFDENPKIHASKQLFVIGHLEFGDLFYNPLATMKCIITEEKVSNWTTTKSIYVINSRIKPARCL